MQTNGNIGTLGVLAFLAIALSGCTINVGVPNGSSFVPSESTESSKEAPTSSSAINDYVSQIQALAPQESEILARYDSVTGENYTDDAALFDTLMELLPDVQNFISKLEAVRPTDTELAELQKTYVEGWNLQSKGMTMAAAALQEQDLSKLAEANDFLSQGRALLSSFAEKLEALK